MLKFSQEKLNKVNPLSISWSVYPDRRCTNMFSSLTLWCARTPVAPLATTPDWGIVPDVLYRFCLGAVFH